MPSSSSSKKSKKTSDKTSEKTSKKRTASDAASDANLDDNDAADGGSTNGGSAIAAIVIEDDEPKDVQRLTQTNRRMARWGNIMELVFSTMFVVTDEETGKEIEKPRPDTVPKLTEEIMECTFWGSTSILRRNTGDDGAGDLNRTHPGSLIYKLPYGIHKALVPVLRRFFDMIHVVVVDGVPTIPYAKSFADVYLQYVYPALTAIRQQFMDEHNIELSMPFSPEFVDKLDAVLLSIKKSKLSRKQMGLFLENVTIWIQELMTKDVDETAAFVKGKQVETLKQMIM